MRKSILFTSFILAFLVVVFLVLFYIMIRNEMFDYFESVLSELARVAIKNSYDVLSDVLNKPPLSSYIRDGKYDKIKKILSNYKEIVGFKIGDYKSSSYLPECSSSQKIKGCNGFIVLNIKAADKNVQIYLDVEGIAQSIHSKRFKIIKGEGTQILENYSIHIVESRIRPNAVVMLVVIFVISMVAFYRLAERFLSYAQYESALASMIKMLEVRDPYTAGHSKRVAQLSRDFAKSLGIKGQKLRTIYKAGLLHDIGKIGIPEKILLKPGKLLPEEFEIIKKHPLLSEDILKSIPGYEEVARIVKYHHERCDGKGYPFGIPCKKIPLETKIVIFADVFDALTSERSYRKKWSVKKTLEFFEENAGTHFDPELTVKFIEFIKKSGRYQESQKVA